MTTKNITSLLGYCSILLLMVSCSQKTFVDSSGSKTKIDEGYLATYTDSNAFVYKSKIYATRDSEKIYPKNFEIGLPRNIKYYQLEDQKEFKFYYDKNQSVFIKVNLEQDKENKKHSDTMYYPSKEETYKFINFDEYSRSDTSKYILQKIPFLTDRKTVILVKENATILLYNIESKNFPNFFRLADNFKFDD